MARITWTNKEDRKTEPYPRVNKVIAADMNEIKESVNALYDLLDTAYTPLSFVVAESDFTASDYQNNELIGKTPMVDFNVFSNAGSGVLLKVGDSYTFNDQTGTITTDADDYLITVWKKLTNA